jgi:hypothetical protein
MLHIYFIMPASFLEQEEVIALLSIDAAVLVPPPDLQAAFDGERRVRPADQAQAAGLE